MEQSGASEQEKRHSKLGITSLVLAVLATIAIVVLFVIAALVGASLVGNSQGLDPQSLQNSPAASRFAIVGLGFLICIILYFVGLVLGLVGVFQRRKKRLYAVLGTVANGLAVLTIISLLVLGAIGAAVGTPQ